VLGARKWQCAVRRTQHAMHNAIIATHNTQRATRTYAHAGAFSSEQRCSRFHPNHNEDHTKQNRVRTRAAYLQSSVIAQLTALCVAARQQRLRHISQNAGDTVFDKHSCPAASKCGWPQSIHCEKVRKSGRTLPQCIRCEGASSAGRQAQLFMTCGGT